MTDTLPSFPGFQSAELEAYFGRWSLAVSGEAANLIDPLLLYGLPPEKAT